MKFENSDDEYGFWQPEPTRKLRRTRPATGATPVVAVDPQGSGATGGQKSGASPRTASSGPSARTAANAAYFDELSELLDHDVAVAMGDVPVVEVRSRRSWRSRLRGDDGRPDPFAVRVGVLVLVGVVAIPLGAGLSAGSATPSGASAVRSTAVVSPATAAPAADPSILTATPATDATAGTTAPAATLDPGTSVTAAVTAESPAAGAPTPSTAASVAATTPASAATDVTVTPATAGAARTEAILESQRAACPSSYRVVGGDYWLGIAARANVKVGALLQANGASSSTPLYPGRTICLPAGATTPVPVASTSTLATAAPTTVPPTTATTVRPATTAKPAATTTPTTKAPTATTPKTTTATTTPATTTPKVTVAPTTAAPTTTVPKRTYSRDEVAQIIRDVWPDDLEDKAVAIATRESNLNPAVRNFCCYGLFQIYFSVHKGWLAGIGITSADQLYDPATNAKAALALYDRDGGWGPWGG